MMRPCRACGVDKSLTDFYLWGDRLTKDCKKCIRLKRNSIYDSKKHTEAQRAFRRRYPDKWKQYQEKWKNKKIAEGSEWQAYKLYPERRREWRRVHKYGLSPSEFSDLMKSQNESCAICGKRFDESEKINVDHCHRTQKVRGLLCTSCNRGLGQFSDSSDLLNKAAKYLDRFAGDVKKLGI